MQELREKQVPVTGAGAPGPALGMMPERQHLHSNSPSVGLPVYIEFSVCEVV